MTSGIGAASYFRETYRQKVLTHAALRLTPVTAETDPASLSRLLRRFLTIEDYRLRMNHNFGASGCETAAARSFVLDLTVKHAFAHASLAFQSNRMADGLPNACALLAIGGYGRAELAPHSDIDLLFLYSGQRLGQMKPVLTNLLQLLWDAGLTVGHSFRTVGDCVTTALDDVHLRTAMVNTRLLAGNKGLHHSLQEALEKDRRRRVRPFLTAILHERDARYLKFGGSVCLQEPNIKETAGGLRDFHTAVWLAHAQHGYKNLAEMRAHDLISEHEARKILRAYDFLWRIRHSVHYRTGRKTEHLSLDMQPNLAEQFGYNPGTYLLGSEKLMRDYYRHARQLQLFSEAITARVTDTEPRTSRRWLRRPANATNEPFAIRSGRLDFDGESEFFDKKPLAIFNAFALGQAARVPFDYRLRELITRSSRAIGPTWRSSLEVSNAFFALLRRRGRAGFVLRSMHDLGLLARLIPEFSRISLLVQHDLYHHFTVDEHTLQAIETLDDLHNSEGRNRAHLRGVLDQIKDPTLLYLALLLHDIGKGQGRGHIARGAQLAERVCRRLGLKEESARKVVLLVKQHVTMAHLAQRRDLNESRLISDFARQVESLDVLNMLLLLTYADLNAVGPGVLTDWKATLLWDLYRRTRKVMTGEDAVIDDVAELARIKDEIGKAIDPGVPFSEVERHLALLPDRYLRITSPAVAAMHIQMIEAIKTEGFACRWVRHSVNSLELIVVTQDRHGLFADLAGTLAANGIEILSAEVNTREDGIAIDGFTVRQASTRRAVEDDRYQAIELSLHRAAKGELDVSALVERWSTRNAPRKRIRTNPGRRRSLPQVICDNEASRSSTVIEVHAIDEPGLAYKIASALAELGLEIVCARIATEKSDALDVFYVTEGDGLKLSDEMIEAVEGALVAKLERVNVIMGGAKPAKMTGGELDEKNRSDYQTASAGRR
ncbi:MAG TPA: [protein-PII] uridylyltransferase [Pyrinomonadaceae bacterium]|nr:[protein-PII] uridylyltransferase [Pyrinomonadaceae bacterium]